MDDFIFLNRITSPMLCYRYNQFSYLLGFWRNGVVLQINTVLFRECWLIMILMFLLMLVMILAILYMFLLFAMLTITNIMVHAMSHWHDFFFFSKKYFTYWGFLSYCMIDIRMYNNRCLQL